MEKVPGLKVAQYKYKNNFAEAYDVKVKPLDIWPFSASCVMEILEQFIHIMFWELCYNNNCVCTGRVPDPTSLFLPTSFCM